jgi:hypothetical protein
MALRSAIADVQRQVEAVHQTAKGIGIRLKAESIGRVLGLHRQLSAIAADVQKTGHLTTADWESIAGVGTELHQALESLHAHVRLTVAEFDEGESLPKREEYLASLADPAQVGGELSLIAVAERALHNWEFLRITRIAATEPEYLAAALDRARDTLRHYGATNTELLEAAAGKLTAVRGIDPLEYHRWMSIPALQASSARAVDALNDFAASTNVEPILIEREVRRPTFADARAEISRRAILARDAVADASRSAGGAAGSQARDLGQRFDRWKNKPRD